RSPVLVIHGKSPVTVTFRAPDADPPVLVSVKTCEAAWSIDTLPKSNAPFDVGANTSTGGLTGWLAAVVHIAAATPPGAHSARDLLVIVSRLIGRPPLCKHLTPEGGA